MSFLKGTLSLIAFFFSVLMLSADSEPVRVAVFADSGSQKNGIDAVTGHLRAAGIEVVHLTGAEIAEGKLEGFNVVVFTGGSGSGQAKSLGEAGRENIRKFVSAGNGYVGICAGAYLACSEFSWGLKILNARLASPVWQRGEGPVKVEILPGAEKITGFSPEVLTIRYENGPILMSDGRKDLPEFEPLAFFRSELSENNSPVGVMVDSPAIVRSDFGKGRVIVSSPHPETTDGLPPVFAPAAVRWAAGKSGRN